MSRFLIIFSFLSFFACNSDTSTDTLNKTTKAEIDDGNAKMIEMLQEAYLKIDPMQVSYFKNISRAEHYKTKMGLAANKSEEIRDQSLYAYELLLAGKTTQSIMELEKIIELFRSFKVEPKMTYGTRQLLAMAYLRMGEQDNCIGKNNPESCIIPIQGEGIYNLKSGSERAINIYESLLKENPEDMETVWLLNIAYMTIGKYPDGVPAKWKLPAKTFKSDYKLPAFKNVSANKNIGIQGLSGGVCIDDFNNDGLLDIVSSSWDLKDQIKIFFNKGDGNFEDHTSESGLIGISGGLNINHADYNNDGHMDILILRGAWFLDQGQIPNSLLKNNGDGTFSDVTIESGLLSKYPTQAATWMDFNQDGWVDLFIGNETSSKIQAPCELFLNNKGKFINTTNPAGLGKIRGLVKGVSSGDVNGDGWPDLYLSIMGSSNKLFINNGRKENTPMVTFVDQTEKAGVQEPILSFPTWMWDYNNDGHLDIFVAPYPMGKLKAAATLGSALNGKTIEGYQPRVYTNKGDGTFTESSSTLGLNEPVFAMGSNYGDLDNDGSLDFYLGTGAPSYTALVPNKMYRNNQGESFQDVTYAGRFGHIQKGHGVSFGDFDNDGDQDIFHILGGAYQGDIFNDILFENPGNNKNNWITLILEGTNSNKSAIGARVKISAKMPDGSTKHFYHMVSTGSSFGSNSLQLETGLGLATTVSEIEIKWPSEKSTISTFRDIKINSFVKLKEGKSEVEYQDRKSFSF